jgi:AAA15 family ATPase/GTPase
VKQQVALQALRLQNFKAIRDSGLLTLTPLTILIGNNGSGKSSLIEGLMTYQMLITQGLDAALNRSATKPYPMRWMKNISAKVGARVNKIH